MKKAKDKDSKLLKKTLAPCPSTSQSYISGSVPESVILPLYKNAFKVRQCIRLWRQHCIPITVESWTLMDFFWCICAFTKLHCRAAFDCCSTAQAQNFGMFGASYQDHGCHDRLCSWRLPHHRIFTVDHFIPDYFPPCNGQIIWSQYAIGNVNTDVKPRILCLDRSPFPTGFHLGSNRFPPILSCQTDMDKSTHELSTRVIFGHCASGSQHGKQTSYVRRLAFVMSHWLCIWCTLSRSECHRSK